MENIMNTRLLCLLLLLSFGSCSDNPHLRTESDVTTDAVTDGSTITSPTGSVACGSGQAGAGNSCSGTTADGNNCGQIPIGNYRVVLAGLQDWYPQKNSSLLYPQKAETELRFKSDGRLRVRVKVNSQPEPFLGIDGNGNQIHACEGRIAGADNPGAHRYDKISFNVNFYTSTQSGNTWVKSQLLQSTHISGVSVDACSNIIDLPAEKIKISSNPILVEIAAVSSDLFCTQQGIYCPSERIMRPQECYDITVQVVNDISDDFK